MRVLSLLVVIIMLGSGGCGKSPPQVDEAKKQVFVFNNGTEPETIDPALMTGHPESTLARSLFEGLTVHDPVDLSPRPGMAATWEISTDGLFYTFHLREAEWSNGEPVTASDFYYSWQRVLNPVTAADYAYQLFYLKNGWDFNRSKITDFSLVGVKVVDEKTLKVELEHPTPYFLYLTSFPTLMPVNRTCVEKYGKRWTRPENIVTNGPFLLQKWIPQQELILEKNPAYWDAANVKLEEIHAQSVEDTETALKMYLAEETDWVKTVPLSRIEQMKKHPDYHSHPYFATYFYRFNVTRKPLDDLRVRKALNLAVDKEAIVRYVTRAGQQPATHFVPPGVGGYESPAGAVFNPAEARRLLAEAGYPGGKGFPRLTILYNTLEGHKKIAEAIQQMWKENLGIDVELYNQEWKVFLPTVIALDYDIARAGWIGDYPDPNTFLDMFVTGGGNNNTGWSNPGYDLLISKAARTFDNHERMALFQEAERILTQEEMPIMPVYFYVSVQMRRPKVKGFYDNILDVHPMKSIYIE